MIGAVVEFGSYALLVPAAVVGYRFRGRMIPKTPKELPIGGNRAQVGPRRYECMCMHLPTTHKRIVAQSDTGATFIRFGKCVSSGCDCNGYIGPLPIGETNVMIVDDMGLEWANIDTVKRELTAKTDEADGLKKEVTRLTNSNKSLQDERQELKERLRKRDHEIEAAVTLERLNKQQLEPPKK